MFSQLDRRGAIDYTTGNEEFDERYAKKWYDSRPKEKDFLGKAFGFPEHVVLGDLARIQKIQTSDTYRKERNPDATMGEYAIAEGIGAHAWLGEGSSARMTSVYDDTFNKADILVTLPISDDEDLMFVYDMTISQDPSVIDKKILSQADLIDRNERTTLKYFRGVRQPVNRYVVGIPPDQIRALSHIILEKSSDAPFERAVQLELIDMTLYQAARQIDYILKTKRVADYSSTDSMETLLAYVDNKGDTLQAHISEQMYKCITDNYLLIQYLMKLRMDLLGSPENKEGAQTLSRLHSLEEQEPVKTLTHFDLDALASRFHHPH